MIHFLVPAAQEFPIKDYVDLFGRALRQDIRILHYEDLVNQREFSRGTYVLAALDQLHAGMAQLLFEIYDQLKQVEGFRFLNDPRNTLQRFELLNKLHDAGRNDFRAFRADADLTRVRFPVFLREESQHEGAISPLLNSEREILEALGLALMQGRKLKDLLIVEFCNTADETGFFRKYAAFIVGKRVIPRSLNYGRRWMLKHSETEFTIPMIQEELEYVSTNPHQQQLEQIFELAQVGYGRIDYAIKDNRVQTWEINLHATIGRGLRRRSKPLPPELDALREKVKRHFYEAFERAWREVDLRTNSEAPIRLTISPQIARAAKARDVPRDRLLTTIRTVLRPAKPLIVPISGPFLFTVGSLARLLGQKRSK
ncbi:MAG TPA: hypothetical protein VIG25_08780 [Pyrinomonadaceae bacterium]|jgi:hypothetical protein